MALQEKAEKGRKGDKFIAHLTPGEIVIPRALAEDDDFRAVINEFFRDNDIDLKKFIVGSGKNKINPETGYMEFWSWNPWKSVSKLWKGSPTAKILKKISPEIEVPPIPELPPPIPTPEDIDVGTQRAGAAARRRLKRRRGRAGTILTEIKPVPLGGRKTILG